MTPRDYGPFDYRPIIDRPRISWPGGARLAVWVIPNIEFFPLDAAIPVQAGGSGTVPDIPGWSARDYGNRVGVFRLMEVLEAFGIRATTAMNSSVADHHPRIVEMCQSLGWEIVGHNQTNSRRVTGMEPEAETAEISATLDRLESATGTRPLGWLSAGLQETWSTLEILEAQGVRYVMNWTNDDQPYRMDLPNGRRIHSVPYSHEINDKPAFERRNVTADGFAGMIRRQFDVLWTEGADSGRVMAIALHPYIIGVPHRIGGLEEGLRHIAGHPDVWFATGSEILEHFLSETSGS